MRLEIGSLTRFYNCDVRIERIGSGGELICMRAAIQAGNQQGRRPDIAFHDRYFGGIIFVAVGPMPVTWTITSPSLAQTKCGVSLGSE